MGSPLQVRGVDRRGITLGRADERPVDVLFDDQRVWSFHVLRDTEPVGLRGRFAQWPAPLARYLDGPTRVVVRDPATGAVHFDDEVQFGTGSDRIRVVNKLGYELGVDKSGRLVPTFETREGDDIAALIAATRRVLDALQDAGVKPFVGYGTLLGAVREGTVLGHDNDADIAYVSDYEYPVDVIRESFRLQRHLNGLGHETVRYSGAAFKVLVTEGDGFRRGLDVFAGFLDHGWLYLMGEVGVPFERDWLYPLGTATLDGVEVPVPARPEKLLEAKYGPGWRVPDPAFKFDTTRATRRALNDWFRGLRHGFQYWQRRAAVSKFRMAHRGPAALAREARTVATDTGATVLDVGAGKGPDALWLARHAVPVIAYDYVTRGLEFAARETEAEELPLEVRLLNLTEWRSWLAEGARLCRIPGPRVVLAQHLLDATTPLGREGFARFCSMALRDGGTVLAQFHVEEAVRAIEWSNAVDPDVVADLLRAQGAARVTVTRIDRQRRPAVVRLVAEWTS